ncbi:hypothetical protein BDV10DRAFT_185423 [Aspergillus recurvatus]
MRPIRAWQIKWRLASAFLMNFGNGMDDSAPGAFILYLEDDYDIGYAIVSLVCIAKAAGSLLAACCTHTFKAKLGYPESDAVLMGLLTAEHIALACRLPFRVLVAAFFLLVFGMTLSIATNKLHHANLANSTTAIGGLPSKDRTALHIAVSSKGLHTDSSGISLTVA